jgi:hydroxysqualene synthase
MSATEEHRSGKTSKGENFPVASALIAQRYRAPIRAYYRFARAADDVADHAGLSPERKFQLLDRLEATLLGRSDDDPAALPLRAEIAAHGLSPEHALDLLTAFRLDVTKQRYRDWDELMHYCRYSAMPVGRFVLDLHGESRASWPANDALCAALQVINHLQDCSKDYISLDRVYVPLDAITANGATVAALRAPKASPELRACLHAVAARTAALLPEAALLPSLVTDVRLSMEIAAIVALARKLTSLLLRRDPLSERVHLTSAAMLATAGLAAASGLLVALRGSLVRATARGDARWL